LFTGVSALKLTDIILVPPLEANSQVMRVVYPSLEERKKLLGLLGIQLVDILGKGSHSEQALPSCDGICAHDRMDRGQVSTDILWCASWSFVYLDFFRVCCSSFQESIAAECRCQALEECAVRLGEPETIVSRARVDDQHTATYRS
jgi:hypothetical protein